MAAAGSHGRRSRAYVDEGLGARAQKCRRALRIVEKKAGGCSYGTGAGSGDRPDPTLRAHRQPKIETNPAVNSRCRTDSPTAGADIETG